MTIRPVKAKAMVVKLLPLQGELFVYTFNPGRCPGLGASALYLSLRPVTVGSGRVGYFQLILQGVLGH